MEKTLPQHLEECRNVGSQLAHARTIFSGENKPVPVALTTLETDIVNYVNWAEMNETILTPAFPGGTATGGKTRGAAIQP